MDRLNHAVLYARRAASRRDNKPGFVYLIQCHDFVKVGMATDVKTRLLALQTGNPYELKLLGSWAVSEMAKSEIRLQNHWKRYEIRGEWYRVPFGELAAAMNATSFEDIFQ